MPDATEWLVEWIDSDGEARYDHIADRDHAIECLRDFVSQGGKTATLYQRVPFTVQVDVTVQAPRKRRRKESTEGAASPRAEEPTTKDAAAQEPAVSPVAVPAGNPASLSLWTCEARFDKDPVCPGPVEFDPVTRGRFCSLHLSAITESGRRELHRRHGARNLPAAPVVKLARAVASGA